MATGTVPASNPAGNNQTSPLAMGKVAGGPTLPSVPQMPSGPASASSNPLVPTGGAPITPGGVIPSVPNAGGLVSSSANVAGTTGALQKQYTDIYGKGVGGALSNLVGSIGGVDSATLQEYIKSLSPEEATAHANLLASLGAGGVDPNSSVAALGEANLQAQEMATIAGESAQLTQSGQQLQANILSGTQQAASQEVAQSGWDVFGQVLQGAAGLTGDVFGAAGKAGGFKNLF